MQPRTAPPKEPIIWNGLTVTMLPSKRRSVGAPGVSLRHDAHARGCPPLTFGREGGVESRNRDHHGSDSGVVADRLARQGVWSRDPDTLVRPGEQRRGQDICVPIPLDSEFDAAAAAQAGHAAAPGRCRFRVKPLASAGQPPGRA